MPYSGVWRIALKLQLPSRWVTISKDHAIANSNVSGKRAALDAGSQIVYGVGRTVTLPAPGRRTNPARYLMIANPTEYTHNSGTLIRYEYWIWKLDTLEKVSGNTHCHDAFKRAGVGTAIPL